MILNIETSSKICSVALCEEGAVWYSIQSENEMDHATKLAPFVDKCIRELNSAGKDLNAVAVSMGPGSYTGLRIGLSLAKGLCFGMNIPLIGIPTLKLLAVKAMFSLDFFEEDLLFIPMIDARRMEVYTAAYNNRLEEVMKPEALIIDEDSYRNFADRTIIMIGDGVKKAREVLKLPVKKWIDKMPTAADMTALAYRDYINENFLDIAYSTPYYLKNFQATIPKNKLNC